MTRVVFPVSYVVSLNARYVSIVLNGAIGGDSLGNGELCMALLN